MFSPSPKDGFLARQICVKLNHIVHNITKRTTFITTTLN
ncbi:hypothetical protein CV83915_2p0272 (plasmid) [Escherichia coli]|uniref:Uncharacterized protein n=1 Tax=Escherichia coli TaxID=562 RepID=A0A2H4TL44_ECOLX|nr:hypothetical protein CV83915_2p0272 [Escherichia coli]